MHMLFLNTIRTKEISTQISYSRSEYDKTGSKPNPNELKPGLRELTQKSHVNEYIDNKKNLKRLYGYLLLFKLYKRKLDSFHSDTYKKHHFYHNIFIIL